MFDDTSKTFIKFNNVQSMGLLIIKNDLTYTGSDSSRHVQQNIVQSNKNILLPRYRSLNFNVHLKVIRMFKP